MSVRLRLNCWVVAMWLWLSGLGRQYIWIRRSHAFGGLIPHFGYAGRAGWRQIKVIEYIPPPKRRWSRDDFVLGFTGSYRVWHFRLLSVRRHTSMAQALADHYWGRHDRSL